MSKVKPDYYGYHIYEHVMGLSYNEQEAKEESWMNEAYFPLYSEETVRTLQFQLEEAQKRIQELEKNINPLTRIDMKENFKLLDENKQLKEQIEDLQKARDYWKFQYEGEANEYNQLKPKLQMVVEWIENGIGEDKYNVSANEAREVINKLIE